MVKSINFVIDLLVDIATFALGALPESPFIEMVIEPLDWGPLGKYVGFFFDIPTMVKHMAMITAACLAYYAVRQLLRWIKMIG
ncbi:hypothetical protein BLD48_10315 [Exiguobacterium sp. KRL4]|uniref:hypothetical protein n=1 Tax=Exiguobacterium sp. KRL4 TaxID=1914536 RepID=UPI0008F87981|nr:hypothetical protein [Exiguobacterium sp. KRL4]OIN66528.1 hypothetical protein BLD48_10315 [Exiguobacterium sp. KRL4]